MEGEEENSGLGPALFVSAIGEAASAYVAIAVGSRGKRMRNGNLN